MLFRSRMEPALNTVAIEAEALLYVSRRRERTVQADLADFIAAKQNLLILLDMAQEAQLLENSTGRPREQQFVDLLHIVTAVSQHLQASLNKVRPS